MPCYLFQSYFSPVSLTLKVSLKHTHWSHTIPHSHWHTQASTAWISSHWAHFYFSVLQSIQRFIFPPDTVFLFSSLSGLFLPILLHFLPHMNISIPPLPILHRSAHTALQQLFVIVASSLLPLPFWISLLPVFTSYTAQLASCPWLPHLLLIISPFLPHISMSFYSSLISFPVFSSSIFSVCHCLFIAIKNVFHSIDVQYSLPGLSLSHNSLTDTYIHTYSIFIIIRLHYSSYISYSCFSLLFISGHMALRLHWQSHCLCLSSRPLPTAFSSVCLLLLHILHRVYSFPLFLMTGL